MTKIKQFLSFVQEKRTKVQQSAAQDKFTSQGSTQTIKIISGFRGIPLSTIMQFIFYLS